MKLSLLMIPLLLVVASTAQAAEEHTFFNEKVLPILEAECYRCHGGEEKLKGGLRLTSQEGLLHGGDLGPAVDLDHPEASLFLQMISYKDEDHQMPPKNKLSDEAIQILTQWVSQGAAYDPAKEIQGAVGHGDSVVQEEDFQYWAYKPVERPTQPQNGQAHPIDAFLQDRLNQAEFPANARASRLTLVRRAYFDLIGLPPTPQQVEAFVKDPRPDDLAWEALIEELLAKPQYGEKWARHWLDLVRYAETNGFERDNPKPEIWRYRDYVIHAFNADKPYDQFVIEQLAGDEIENPSMESLAATGYHRLMQWDDEPADRKQHVYDVLADNVATTTETFLGSTLGCARCHDHKADPFTQADYYSFMAFFHGITPYKTEGTLTHWADPQQLDEFEKAKGKRLNTAQAELRAVEADLEEWLRQNGRLDEAGKTKVATFVDDARGVPATWEYTTKTPTPDWHTVGFRNKSWFKAQGGFGTKGTPGSIATTEWNTSDIWMRTDFGLKEIPKSLVLEIHHDEDVQVYLNGALIFENTGYLKDYASYELGTEALDALQTGKNVIAVHCRQSGGGQYIDLALRTGAQKADNLNEAIKRGGKLLVEELKKELGRDLVKERRDILGEIDRIRKDSIGTPINCVQEYGAEPQPMHIHVRGSAHAPGKEVAPAFPGVLLASFEPVAASIPEPGKGQSSSGRRLALAKWIASRENPLTARVMANRIWQHHFGRGIVPSTSDFGVLGEDPTHPELLNWLAAEFMDQGWSIKTMHRLIMTSEAYQRASTPSEIALAKDPTNRLFWRFDMRRLTAEELRDSILAVSGMLNPEQGGPEVFPPLPEAVLATASRPGKGWPTSKGDDAYRRSIYIHVKRSLRVPILVDHDQADTDNACAVRFTTTVPSQALCLLNGEFTNQQAHHFADRILKEGGNTLEEQIRYGLRLALQRDPSQGQVDACLEMCSRLETEANLDAEALVDRFALMTLNLNEFLYLD